MSTPITSIVGVTVGASEIAVHERGRRVRAGSKWIGVLAVMFAVSGPILFEIHRMEADQAVAALDAFSADEVLRPIDGRIYTAGQLRAQVMGEPLQVLVVNLVLSGLLAALWVWARRAPLPAIACALALFLVVQVVSTVLAPSSIYQGIVLKLLALVALVRGFKAALAARAEMQSRPAS